MSTKHKGLIVLCLLAAGVIGLCLHGRWDDVFGDPAAVEAREMKALIDRLANVYRAPIAVAPHVVIYQPKMDDTVMDEIRAKGTRAIPHLIAGLNHTDREVVGGCIRLLGEMPCRSALEALVVLTKSLRVSKDAVDTTPGWLQESLYELTGFNSPFSPPSSQPYDQDQPYDMSAMQQIWLPWWEQNKDRIVDTATGIGLRNDDGTITPLPLKKDEPKKDKAPDKQE